MKINPINREMHEWAKQNNRVPSSTIIAATEPYEIGQVVFCAPYRFVISEQISKQEFMREVRSHAKKPNRVRGVFSSIPGNETEWIDPVPGESVTIGIGPEKPDKPPKEHKYFYRATYIGEMQQ